ncbi:MAG: hypothetical protein M3Q31_20490, partial [Actinomycetota bacterium]|nr:hypothetical protein [Actinomycetota bacterium]
MLGGLADVDGHHRAQAGCRRCLAATNDQLAQPGGDDRQHDVVDRPAQRALDRLDLVERDFGHRDPAVLAERHVQARARGCDELVAHEDLDQAARGAE